MSRICDIGPLRVNYKNNRYLPGNNRHVLEHNRQIWGNWGIA